MGRVFHGVCGHVKRVILTMKRLKILKKEEEKKVKSSGKNNKILSADDTDFKTRENKKTTSEYESSRTKRFKRQRFTANRSVDYRLKNISARKFGTSGNSGVCYCWAAVKFNSIASDELFGWPILDEL